MEIDKDRSTHGVVAFLLLVGFVYVLLLLRNPTGSDLVSQVKHKHPGTMSRDTTGVSYKDKLDEALAMASMAAKNKTVIIAVANKAYVEGNKPMLDLFLDAFWAGDGTRPLVDHLLLVAVDRTSFDRCKFLKLHCYHLEAEHDDDSDQEHLFMSDGFLRMMWRRTLFLGDVLRRGYSFIFTDTDVMWLRDPFQWLSQDETVDLQISNDRFNGNDRSESNPINTGFYMIRSNNKTISLFEDWYARRNSSGGLKDQDVLVNMMNEGVFRRLGLNVRFLDTVHFSGFCQDSGDVRVVSTVHANCCRTVRAKVADLMEVIHDWKRFKGNENAPFAWTSHTACADSWH